MDLGTIGLIIAVGGICLIIGLIIGALLASRYIGEDDTSNSYAVNLYERGRYCDSYNHTRSATKPLTIEIAEGTAVISINARLHSNSSIEFAQQTSVFLATMREIHPNNLSDLKLETNKAVSDSLGLISSQGMCDLRIDARITPPPPPVTTTEQVAEVER